MCWLAAGEDRTLFRKMRIVGGLSGVGRALDVPDSVQISPVPTGTHRHRHMHRQTAIPLGGDVSRTFFNAAPSGCIEI